MAITIPFLNQSLSPSQARLLRLSILSCGTFVVLYFLLSIFHTVPTLTSSTRSKSHLPTAALPVKNHQRVLVGSSFGAHEDVYMSFVGTLGQLLPKDNVRVYSSSFRYGFEEVVKDIGIYEGKVHPIDEFMADVNNPDAFGSGRGKADMIVLGTCERDMAAYSADLWASWTARPADQKFTIICIVHNAFEPDWIVDYGQNWVRNGALRLMPISEHVKRAFLYRLDTFADAPATHTVGYEYIPIHVHLPILPVNTYLRPKPRTSGNIISNAVIQGNFDPMRRDYVGIFQDLAEELKIDPESWGYHVKDNVYMPLLNSELPPFTLHLLGNGQIAIPPALAHIVQVHSGLAYADFFAFMSSMDVAILAFTERGGYFEVQASSSVAMAVMCEVPLLVTHHIQKVYTYTSDPRVSIHRPASLREIAAIKVLRTGVWQTEEGVDYPPPLEGEVRDMVKYGWQKTARGWKMYKSEIQEANLRIGRKVLRGE